VDKEQCKHNNTNHQNLFGLALEKTSLERSQVVGAGA